jgi:hypothetical protein
MPVREAPPHSAPPPKEAPYPAEKARGGEIILRERWQRGIFIGGLVGALLLALLLRLFS